MFTTLKIKIAAALLASATSVPSGEHPIVHRSSADNYAVAGEGTLRTRGCTVTANGLRARISAPDVRGFRWITFLDRDGGFEAMCAVDDGAPRATAVVQVVKIRRSIAVVGQ